MNAMTPEDVSKLGQRAAEVLDNPAYQRAFRLMREEIVGAWATADVRDQAGQQLLLQQMKVLNRLQETLASVMKAGEDVDKLLERHQRESDKDINEGAMRQGLRAVRRMAQRTG